MKISIITVCYNSEKTIENTILSVLSQNYIDIEYIIVDGNGIDCDDIVHDLILVGDNGVIKYGPKNSGAHYLDGAKRVVNEIMGY